MRRPPRAGAPGWAFPSGGAPGTLAAQGVHAKAAGDLVDWDWEDGPSRDAPRGAPPDGGPQTPDESPLPDQQRSSFSDAIDRFEEPPEYAGPVRDAGAEPAAVHEQDAGVPEFDDDRTQIIRRPQDLGGSPIERGSSREPFDSEPRTPRPDLERPRVRTIEAAQRSLSAEAADRRSEGRSPRAPADRAAARARRRRQVRRRRLVALVVLIVIVVLVALVVVRGCGGSSAGASASPSPAPVALRTPTAAQPLRMAAYGESVGGGALLGIKLLTGQRKDIKVHRFVKVATGLARPDFFDWPVYLRQDMARRKHPFEAVALMLGANDGQDVKVDGKQLKFGTAAWKAMYARRVGAVMDYYLRSGVKRVYWAGMPRMGIDWFNQRMDVLNGIFKAEAAKRGPRVDYVDEWTAVDAPATAYQADLRQSDGVHLETAGGMKAARAIMAAVARDWHLPAFTEKQ